MHSVQRKLRPIEQQLGSGVSFWHVPAHQQALAEPAAAADSLRSAALAAEPQAVRRRGENELFLAFSSITAMIIEESVTRRIQELLKASTDLSMGNEYGQCPDEEQQQACSAWITAAQNVVHLICPRPDTPYRQKADRIAGASRGLTIHKAVGELAAVLKGLLSDAQAGLIAAVADQARAEIFDDFLDHADAYARDGRKNESGVIAGVVFEDALRRVCRKQGVPEKDRKLDDLISELATRGELSGIKAKRARAAAHVRTRASHAQWDEFELDDVRSTIALAREIIAAKLDA